MYLMVLWLRDEPEEQYLLQAAQYETPFWLTETERNIFARDQVHPDALIRHVMKMLDG
jgi:hypothetical protein